MAPKDARSRASGTQVLLTSAALIAVAVGGAVGLMRADKGRDRRAQRGPVVQWQPVFPKPGHNSLEGVWGSGLHVVTVGRVGTILVSHDLGLTWRVRPSRVTEDLHSVWGDGRGVIVAVGNNGAVVRSDDWGDTWARRTLAVPASADSGAPAADAGSAASSIARVEAGPGSLTELWGDASSGELWASGRFGWTARSTDRGLTWTAIATGSTADLYAIWSDGRGTVLAAGRDGTIVKSTDRGAHFSARPSNTRSTLLGFHSDGATLLAVGWYGTVLQSNDRGEQWTAVPVSTQEDLTSVVSLGGALVAVGQRGTSVARRNGAWSALTTNASETLGGVWSDGRVAIAVGTEGAIYRIHDQGARWEPRHGRVQGSALSVTGFGRGR